MHDTSKSIIQSIFLATALAFLRNILILWQSPYWSLEYTLGTLTSIPENALLLFAPILLINLKQKALNIVGIIILVIMLLFHQISIHYEIVFGRLPGVSILYYLNELQHLTPSINSNLPLWLFFTEAVAIMLLWKLSPQKLQLSRPTTTLLAISMVSATAVANQNVEALPDGAYWGSKTAIGWAVQSALIHRQPDETKTLSRDQIWEFQQLIGQSLPKGGTTIEYPLCGPLTHDPAPNNRNVIILFLEGVGEKEMNMQVDGKQVMPHLSQFSTNNTYFQNTFSSGTKSSQALISVFTGLPAQPIKNILWERPLPNMQSFIQKLSLNNYQTGYFSGSDLSFEQQRLFLNNIGFSSINEFDPNKSIPTYGWGYDDKTVFTQMRTWIKQQNNTPYFASFFTQSTHDPYILPADWEPVFSETNNEGLLNKVNWTTSAPNKKNAMIDSYHFLDHQLGEFIRWYEKEEKQKDTILVLFGDHTPHYWNEAHDKKVREMTFKVPLIIAGNDIAPEKNTSDISQRLATLSDISATLSALLEIPPPACDQGIDLLQKKWPKDRWVYSVGGDSQERVYMWNQNGQILFDRIKKEIQILDHETAGNPSPSTNEIRLQKAQRFIELIFATNQYLIKNNAYAPESARPDTQSITRTSKPIIISHRGNINGPNSQEQENSRGALTNVINSQFDWVEIDFQITADGIPVALHDSHIKRGEETILIADLSLVELHAIPSLKETLTLDDVLTEYGQHLNILIEAKPPAQKTISYYFSLANYISSAVKKYQGPKRIIVDSFHPVIATSINEHCDCEVGQDAPFMKRIDERYIKSLAAQNLEWVYLHHSVIDKATIEMAHQHGIKVMAYTVNDASIIEGWGDTLPDGIITDTQNILSLMHASP